MGIIKLENYDAVIFDMDGVLTDSEPIWKIAMEEVFGEVRCNLNRQDFQKTVGLRLDEVVAYWYSVVQWENYSATEVENMIVQRMNVLLRAQATPLPGVIEALNYFKEHNKKIGLATSSYTLLIDAILETIGVREYFDVVWSAEHEA